LLRIIEQKNQRNNRTMDITHAKDALKKYFGYDSFRPMQADIIQAIYEHQDVLVLMPTGGGKSVCFQIPAVTMEGVGVVVSPLISLMKDQVEGLRANGIKASFLNSSQTIGEQRQVEDDLYNGNLDLVYVSPEKIVSSNFISLLQSIKVALFAIDEAHCISAWGHDFRPEYTQMRFLKQKFPNVSIVALTATADRATRKDICKQLHQHNPQVYLDSFDRPNLSLTVKPGQKRFEQIMDFIKDRPDQSGIIYCLSRKNTEDLAGKLLKKGIKADFYHAGMTSRERSKVQEDFINDRIPIVCATIAFGMGIDKSNVRWIIHYNLPKNIESFYQEIGRAGRDGAKADTMLFYSYQDVMVLRDILSQNNSKQSELQLAKLERMKQYAEAMTCRRQLLLTYFSEQKKAQCGNCDICKNPPEYFDGTTITQKALSAVARLKQQVSSSMLIDVLRGSGRKEIMQRGYQNIKTYGAGRDLPIRDWQFYLMQIINKGLLEIAYDEHGALKLTPLSKSVLFEGTKIQLVKMQIANQRQAAAKAKAKPKTKRERVRDELFERLRQLRRTLAQKNGIPPYLIFSDKTLEEMAATRPLLDKDMLEVSGVGEQKLKRYGDLFMDAILTYIKEQQQAGIKIQGTTHIITYDLYKQGLSVEEIAAKRELNPITIYSHLAHLYQKGEPIDLFKFFTQAEYDRIEAAIQAMVPPFVNKDIFEYLKEEVPYYKIKFALVHYDKLYSEEIN